MSESRPHGQQQILLLTATITPPAGVPNLVVTDPDSRLRDYERALAYYATLIGRSFDSIVFCENSDASLVSLRRVADGSGQGSAIEMMSFQGTDHPSFYGRAYGEFRLIDHAMDHSQILRNARNPVIWKCTGRYLVRNMRYIVADPPRSFDIYCNKRDFPHRWCDMYLLAWNRRGYETMLRGISPRVREGPGELRPPETLFRTILDEHEERLTIVPRFRHVPLIDARKGTDGISYSGAWWDKKILLRNVALRVAPWLWI